jgi:hypothetical protein
MAVARESSDIHALAETLGSRAHDWDKQLADVHHEADATEREQDNFLTDINGSLNALRGIAGLPSRDSNELRDAGARSASGRDRSDT